MQLANASIPAYKAEFDCNKVQPRVLFVGNSKREVTLFSKQRTSRFASLILGAAFFVAFIYVVGVKSIGQILLQINPLFLIIMLGMEVLGFAFYAGGWYLLIQSTQHRIRFLSCLGITLASVFLSLTMPSGVFLEASRCILGSRESNMMLGESTAAVILHRILYVVGFLMTMVVALVAIIVERHLSNSMILQLGLLQAVALVALGVFFYLSLNPRRVKPIVSFALRLAGPLINLVQTESRLTQKTEQFLTDYNSSFRMMLASTRKIIAAFFISLCDWTCSVLILWIALTAVGPRVSVWVVIVTLAIGEIIQMIPIAVPGMLGIYETGITASLSLFGVPVAMAASAALLTRIVTSWLDLPLAGLAAYHYGYKALTMSIQ